MPHFRNASSGILS